MAEAMPFGNKKLLRGRVEAGLSRKEKAGSV
jgi:hypothetical protein